MEGEYRIGSLILRPRRGLRAGASHLSLGGRALDLLSALAEARGEIVTKDELFNAVWPGLIVEENALQAQISFVRKALGAEARRLVTVRGRGYRLELDDFAQAEPSAASIAVLPFDSLEKDTCHDYLADGLAEELIATLSGVRGLKVASRTSSFAYRGQARDLRKVAAELGVSTLLESSVRVAEGRVRITAQLIDATNGFHLWAQSFEKPLSDLLVIQEELARELTIALQRELGPRIPDTSDPEAMRLLFEARAASAKLTPEGLESGARLARESLERDPGFAKAWASLAGTVYAMANVGFLPKAGFAEARRAASKAIALDPSVAGAYEIVALVDAAMGRFMSAIEQMERALAVDFEDGAVADGAIINLFVPLGYRTHARYLADRLVRIAPARPRPYLARALCAADIDETEYYLELALARGQPEARPPVEIMRFEIALARRRFPEAAAALTTWAERELKVRGAGLAMNDAVLAMQESDRSGGAAKVADLVLAADRAGTLWAHPGTPGLLLTMQERLGDREGAYVTAHRLVEHWHQSGRMPTGSITSLLIGDLADFRRDTRFQTIVEGLGLIPCWTVHGPPEGHRMDNGRLIVL
ncbi:winged helix-turn-helix domain-containing protein [Novosphingobium sp. Gsoil 351]|uniref:winged helix-turn-helix domain-containing tetratricopeptide repeat protein n=1 Tax=Novosphingobium sp. Gsoil 351 TaxID=2675225 RepID=UPI0012B497EA|nr:winged helix-turn-helix domain-containing protein [Novosphingobium sp. Gsoil 351]QGN55044.1 hypothetical protein GKE62_11230 [Novosphingobium sp. Gsoil 351]